VPPKVPSAESPPRRATGTTQPAPAEPGRREIMIREAAYYRAERRGFTAGHELEDWLAAEEEVDRWFATRGAPRRYGTGR